MLKVCGPPPPVPTQSTSSALSSSEKGSGTARRRITSTKPVSSGACSPRVARTASIAAVSTSGTWPVRISSRTLAACSRERAAPSSASGRSSSFTSDMRKVWQSRAVGGKTTEERRGVPRLCSPTLARGFPPFPQKARKGWGTDLLVLPPALDGLGVDAGFLAARRADMACISRPQCERLMPICIAIMMTLPVPQ